MILGVAERGLMCVVLKDIPQLGPKEKAGAPVVVAAQ